MTKIPAMLLWTDAYLGDTKHLTTFEHGAYLLILMAMWRNGGILAKDSKKLALVAGCPMPQWNKIEKTIMKFMTIVEDSNGELITQKRLRDEIVSALASHKKRELAGSIGGRAKALKYNSHASSNANSFSSNALPTTSHQYKKESLNGLGQKRGNGSATTSEAEQSMNEEELRRHVAGHKVYVERDTPAGEAWAAWARANLGKSQVWDAKGGWWFPSEYPPKQPSSGS